MASMAVTATLLGTSDTMPSSLIRPWLASTFAMPRAVTSSHHLDRSVSMITRGFDDEADAETTDADAGIDTDSDETPTANVESTTATALHVFALAGISRLLHHRATACRATLT